MASRKCHCALASIPHGAEFRFLDRLDALVPGQSGTGEYTLRGNEHFLRGHFPDHPLMPGVLLLEAAAQLAGTVAQCDPTIEPLGICDSPHCGRQKFWARQLPAKPSSSRLGLSVAWETSCKRRPPRYINGQLILQTEITLSGDSA